MAKKQTRPQKTYLVEIYANLLGQKTESFTVIGNDVQLMSDATNPAFLSIVNAQGKSVFTVPAAQVRQIKITSQGNDECPKLQTAQIKQ